MSVVTIGELGSGRRNGRQIADGLRADYVDREIIAEVVHSSGRRKRTKGDTAEQCPGRIAEAWDTAAWAEGIAFGKYLL
jgi:hypothetical protein